MTRYSVVSYTPTHSPCSGIAATRVFSATESIGSVESGWLDSVQMYNLADVKRGFVLYLYGANVSVGAELAAFAPSDTATSELLSIITFSSGGYIDLTNNLFQMKSAAESDVGLGTWLQPSAPATDAAIYAALITPTTGAKVGTGTLEFKFNFRHE